jgi:hypothetical protein
VEKIAAVLIDSTNLIVIVIVIKNNNKKTEYIKIQEDEAERRLKNY